MNKFDKLNNYTVLYIEDDLGIQNNIKEILEYYFRKVFLSSNIKNAEKLYLENRPDLIITDIKLENETGIEFIKKIRQNDKNTRVIITSAYTNTDYLLSATELFLLRYIVKPITQDKLNEAFELFLDSYKNDDIYYLTKNSYFDINRSIVKIDEVDFVLTKKESMFLKLLLSSRNRVVSYEEIQNYICDDDSNMSQNALRLFIKNLRKKLPDNFLTNMQGVGYYCSIEPK
ncbi:response regulator transcription factor [Arcobacter vandammei]|uniref:response regulator transcription factor n=1 Tax=Arcobacter vandammei TaxID=2782243 RepID=UPI001D184563|nr:response regulator [Arcobacter vandammei]